MLAFLFLPGFAGLAEWETNRVADIFLPPLSNFHETYCPLGPVLSFQACCVGACFAEGAGVDDEVVD